MASIITNQPEAVADAAQLTCQIKEHLPTRPLQCSCCCGKKWDLLDSSMCCLSTCPIAGVVLSLVSSHPYFAAIFGASALGNVIAHGLVRKYGSISRVVEKLTSDEGILTKIFGQFERVQHALTEEKKALSQTVATIEEAVKDVAVEHEHLSEKIKVIIDGWSKAKETIDALTKQNEDLTARVSQLDLLIGQIKSKVMLFQEQNIEFSSSLVDLGKQVEAVEAIDQKLKGDMEHLDKMFDEDVADFAKVVLQTQMQSQKISEFFLSQNRQLTEQIQQLELSANTLKTAVEMVQGDVNDPLLDELTKIKDCMWLLEKELDSMRLKLEEKDRVLQNQDALVDVLQKQLKTMQAAEESVQSNFSPLLSALRAIKEESSHAEETIRTDNEQLTRHLLSLQERSGINLSKKYSLL